MAKVFFTEQESGNKILSAESGYPGSEPDKK